MKPEASEATPAITAREAELEAMRRMLVASDGCFSLSVAVCGAFLRDQIIHQLQAESDGIQVVAVPQGTVDVFGAITSALGDRTPSALFVVGLEESVEAEEYAALRSLNASRELLERRFPCPVVFWVPASVAALIALHAPDFWRYHSHQFEFTLEDVAIVGQPSAAYSGSVRAAGQLVADAKRLRITELESRLAETERPSGIVPPTTHLLLWFDELAFLYWYVGRLDRADSTLHKALVISEKLGRPDGMASALSNLGLIQLARGDLDRAEVLIRKSLALEEKLGHHKGMATTYGSLGLIYRTRGDSDRAEDMHRKALAISEKYGHQEGMARHYGNLGGIYQMRGDLDRAEEMLRKSLAINEKLGRQEEMASQFGNLGMIYKTRGDLDYAEEMLRKALALYEKFGRREGMAAQHGNLGLIHVTRGDLDRADEEFRKALVINEELGRPEGIAIQYGNLGIIYQARDDLDHAEKMYRKSLAINKRLGHLEGMAIQYGNLGTTYQTRGNLGEARRLWTKARELFEKIGMEPELRQTEALLSALDNGS